MVREEIKQVIGGHDDSRSGFFEVDDVLSYPMKVVEVRR